MGDHWLDITDIPAEGRQFILDDQSLLTEGLAEFGMAYRLDGHFCSSFTVIPASRGVVVRGALQACLVEPCDRCASPAHVLVDQAFDLYEDESPSGEEPLGQTFLRRKGKTLELNAGALLWEEFLLGLPTKPLCRPDCKGLCPVCGVDRNVETCDCMRSGDDPRLAALRGLTIDKKKDDM